MEEFNNIIKKYNKSYISQLNHLENLEDINQFALVFYKDVAEVYDCITRVKNIERNPTGFDLIDSPILGLLVKIWKLLKTIIEFYEENKGEMISILERSLIEVAITASYLLKNDESVIEDYRKCSYKDRLNILKELKKGSPLFQTKAGVRLLKSVNEKMTLEGFSIDDFKTQKANRWKLQGKSFFDIFKEVSHENLYKYTYGMMSESIHGSWNDSMDFYLYRNEDNTFSTNPFYQETDIRFISPILNFCNDPYKTWIQRIGCNDKDVLNILNILNLIEKINSKLLFQFDKHYDDWESITDNYE
jgi:hypothetical protein